MNRIKIGIVGFGNWGKKIYQTLKNFPECEIVGICDKKNIEVTENVIVTENYQDLIKRNLDAVIIATPNDTHYDIAYKFLSSNINLFVEKPLATSYREALSLIHLAEKKNLNLFTGHILLYHPLVKELKKYLERNKNWCLKVMRTNNSLPSYYTPKDILYDFGPHDISLILFLFEEEFDELELKLEKKLLNFNFFIDRKIRISGMWGENGEEKERKVIAKFNGQEIIFDDNLGVLKSKTNKKEKIIKKINRKLPLYWELRFFLTSLINKNIKEIIPTKKIMKIIDKIEKRL